MTAPVPAVSLAQDLRRCFDRVDFTTDRVADAIGSTGDAVVPAPEQVQLVLRRLPGGDLGTLIRLFVLGAAAARDVVAEAVAPLPVDVAVAEGLLTGGGEVRATVRIMPRDRLLLASDFESRGEPTPPDHVMGVTMSTLMLANLTMRTDVQSVLDVGTGSGIQALLAAGHATRVVATDINQRALALAEFNAELNRVKSIEFRPGSYLEPVAGEQFDLILSNPPFVVSPVSEVLYRDDPRPGDAVSEQLVRAVPEHLSDGGWGHVLVSWMCRGGEMWDQPLRRWVAGLGCDVWLLHHTSDDPGHYAASWNHPLRGDPDAYTAAVEAWLQFFAAEQVTSIGYGAVLLRRTSAVPWLRVEDLAGQPVTPYAGMHLAALTAVQDHLSTLDDDALLRSRPRRPLPIQLDQTMQLGDDKWVVSRAAATVGAPIAFRAAVDEFAALLLTRLNGERTLGDAIDECVAALAETPAEAATSSATAVAMARRMCETGFLDPRPGS